LPVTKAGANFLKCAFASPDFSVDPGSGIPDDYDGKALMRKDVWVQTFSFTEERDTFLIVLPTPGVSYWQCEVAVGSFPTQTTVWTPRYNASFTTLFGATTNQAADAPTNPVERDRNVTKFRYASNTCELTPTSNFTQFSGSITVWKLPVAMADVVQTTGVGQAQATTVQKALVGLEGVSRVSPDNKPFKFLDGAYSMAVNTEPTWDFTEVLSGVIRVPTTGQSATTNPTFGQLQGDFIGVGHLQALVFRVSTPKGAINTAIGKFWSCIEYQPNPVSAFYEFSGTSPPCDKLALQAYRDIALKVPVAVSVIENDGFWSDRVMPILRNFLRSARVVGGVIPQVGAVVGGLDALSDLFSSL